MNEKISFPMRLPPRQLEFYYAMNRLFGKMQFKLQQRMLKGEYITHPIAEMGMLLESVCDEFIQEGEATNGDGDKDCCHH